MPDITRRAFIASALCSPALLAETRQLALCGGCFGGSTGMCLLELDPVTGELAYRNAVSTSSVANVERAQRITTDSLHRLVPSGSGRGTRHVVLHPNGRYCYSIHEEDWALTFFAFDPARASLEARQIVSMLPRGFTGATVTSAMLVSPDGRFLYIANPLFNSIAQLVINRIGRLAPIRQEWTRGDYPRHISTDRSGNYLFVCNERSGDITTFRVNRGSGQLTPTGHFTGIAHPSFLLFL